MQISDNCYLFMLFKAEITSNREYVTIKRTPNNYFGTDSLAQSLLSRSNKIKS